MEDCPENDVGVGVCGLSIVCHGDDDLYFFIFGPLRKIKGQ